MAANPELHSILSVDHFNGGISESEKEGMKGSAFFSQGFDIYSEATKMTVLPGPTKVSGSTVTDLVKWGVAGTPYDANKYFYDGAGNIYQENAGGVWSLLRAVASSNGQGMDLAQDYLYYAQNSQIGRYGPLSGAPVFTDNWQTGLADTSTTKLAPVKSFLSGFAVGHGNKLGWWDGSVWTAAQLTLPPGLQIRSLEVIDEMLAIGTWRGTAVTDNEEGYIFFWDGASTSYNYFFALPEGGLNAMLNTQNRLLSVAGSAGYMYMGYNPFQKIMKLPKLALGKYVEVFPGAVTNWKGLAFIGFGANTDSSDITQGVYSYGTKTSRYPEAFSFAFPISTGTIAGTNLKIGMVKGWGNNLYVGWRDGTTYGVDKVASSGTPYTTASWESLIFSGEKVYNDSQALVIKARHLPLPAGASIQLGYKIDRATNYTFNTANSTTDSTETRLSFPLAANRFREIQFKVIATSAATGPTILYLGLQFDALEQETDY